MGDLCGLKIVLGRMIKKNENCYERVRTERAILTVCASPDILAISK